MADNTPLTLQHARHLLRRTGFGATQAATSAFMASNPTRGQAANTLLGYKSSGFKPGGRDQSSIHDKWVKYMLKVKFPLQEKLVLFWHDHFSTSIDKVGDAQLMSRQNQLIRLNGKGNFKTFVKAMNVNPAMMEFLDTVRNHVDIPNENYARELQELFTLGVKDFNGIDNYTQVDVRQIARAFTGHDYDKKGPIFLDYDHDFTTEDPGQSRGPKVIYQSTGGAGGPSGKNFGTLYGEGPLEVDAVIDIIFEHTDSDGKNTVARRTARRLIEYFAHPVDEQISAQDRAFVDAVVAASLFDTSWDLTALLHQIFVHDDFYITADPAYSAALKSVKWPIDFVVGTLRMLDMKLKGRDQFVDGGDYSAIRDQLTNMGQTLFAPPSVFGWDWETSWISSATLLARYGFARDITSARSGGSSDFRPEKFFDLDLTDPDAIRDAVTDVLGVTDDLTAAEKSTLTSYLTDGGTMATIDLTDYDTRNRKLNGLFALVMQSPAYQLH